MANYVSKHTGAQIDAAVDKTGELDGRVTKLSEEILGIKGDLSEKTVKVAFGSGINKDTGEIRPSQEMWCTGYVATAGYKKVEYYGRLLRGILLAFYDENKTFMKSESIEGPQEELSFAGGTVDIPSGAAYAAVASYGIDASTGGAGYLRLFNEGGSGMAGLEYTVADLMGKVNPLKGKRFAVLGDSISSVNYTLPVWWQIIAEKYGCEFVNYGVSSTRIAVSDANTQSFVERYTAMDDTVDGVIVVGGTNDVWYTPIGEFNSTDNTTLNGALNEMLPGLLNKYPGKPVMVFAPIQREDYTESDYPVTVADLKTLEATAVIGRERINLAIMVKCRQYGVPCVDLYAACGINGNDASSVYFRTDDSLHPSALGMQRIAGVVAAEMVKHFMFVD
jgi:lysophospholipase L1-like esterase